MNLSKIAISSIAWQASEEEAIFRLLRKSKICNIETTPSMLPSYRFDKSGMNSFKVVAMQSLLFQHPELNIFNNRIARLRTLKYLKKIIKMAVNSDIKILVFGCPKNKLREEVSLEEADKIATSWFKKVAKIAADNKLCFCIEPTPLEYEADYLTNLKEVINLVKMVNSPGLGINLDLGSIRINNESNKKDLQEAGPYIKHVHISEPFLKPLRNKKWVAFLDSFLKQIDYDGFTSIEMLAEKKHVSRDINVSRICKALKIIKEI